MHSTLNLSILLLVLKPTSSLFLKSPLIPDPSLKATCQGECIPCWECWMQWGSAVSYCGGLIFVCCEKDAQSRKLHLSNEDQYLSSDEDLQVFPDIDFGQVKNEKNCGRQLRIASRRIVGGQDAGFARFPWQALIEVGNSRCGGALINPQHVVTAGHCVHRSKRSSIKVTLGEYRLNDLSEPLLSQEFSVSSIYLHPFYSFTPQADRFDVAVLRLQRPAMLASHVAPICLPEKHAGPAEGRVAMVAGWGAVHPLDAARPDTLQMVDVHIINGSQCQQWHRSKGIHMTIYRDMLCAGHKEGSKDACQGDSGGPLMIFDENFRWTLVGIVSAGFGCAVESQPGIYHNVASTSDWIYHVANLVSQ